MPRYVGKDFGQAFIQRFARAEASVRRRLHDFLDRARPTRRQRMVETAAAQKVLRELGDDVPREVKELIQKAYTSAASQAGRDRPKASGVGDTANLSDIEREAVQLLASSLTATLNGAVYTLGRQSTDVFRQHALRGALGQKAGLAGDLVEKRMEQRLLQEGMTAFIDSTGRRWNLRHYCEMAIKTAAAEAQNLAVVNVCIARGIDLVDIDTVKNSCVKCLPWDGKTFSLTGATAGYPILTMIPPFHPLCNHYLRVSAKAVALELKVPLNRGTLELASVIAQRQRQHRQREAAVAA